MIRFFPLGIVNLFSRLARFLSDEIPEDERIHREFKYKHDENGFHYNASGIGPIDDTHRLQVFLNRDELAKLDQSPFIGKIAPNENDDLPYDYCAFFYLNGDQKFAQLERWAREQNFQKIIPFHSPPTSYFPAPLLGKNG